MSYFQNYNNYEFNQVPFQMPKWDTSYLQFNNSGFNFGSFNNFSNPFNFSLGTVASTQSTTNSTTTSISSGDKKYDEWYAKQMASGNSTNSSDSIFLEERNKEVSRIKTVLQDTEDKIEKLKKKKSDSNTIIETKLLEKPELDENGDIKKPNKTEKGFWEKSIEWVGSAGTSLLNLGKSIVGYDKDGKWSPKKALTNAAITATAIGATCIPVIGPAIGYGMLAYGLGNGVVGAMKGIKKLNNTDNEKEKEEARQNICSNVVIAALSAFGLKGLGKTASTANTVAAPKTSILAKLGNGIKSFTTDPLKATSQAIKSDISAVRTNGFFSTLGSKATAMFTNKSFKYDDKYTEMETRLNNQISDLNTKIASETNPAKKVLLEEHRAMAQNNLNELQNLQNLKTKVEFDKLKTTNSSTKNQESFSNYTQNGSGYEINGQTVSQEGFAQFKADMNAWQKSYNKDLQKLIKAKEYSMRKLAKDPDAHRTELDQYTQSSIRAKYKTRQALKDGIKDINNQITDITGKISRAEEKLSTQTNPRAIANLQNQINNLKATQANLENELAVCNSIKIRSYRSPFTWFQKNEYILSMGEGNATYGVLGNAIKNSVKNPAAMPLYAYSQWDKSFSVPSFSVDLKEFTPEELEETIKNLEAEKSQLAQTIDVYNNIKTSQEWETFKAQLEAKNNTAEESQTTNNETTQNTENNTEENAEKTEVEDKNS